MNYEGVSRIDYPVEPVTHFGLRMHAVEAPKHTVDLSEFTIQGSFDFIGRFSNGIHDLIRLFAISIRSYS